jgi:hypothetical protein
VIAVAGGAPAEPGALPEDPEHAQTTTKKSSPDNRPMSSTPEKVYTVGVEVFEKYDSWSAAPKENARRGLTVPLA